MSRDCLAQEHNTVSIQASNRTRGPLDLEFNALTQDVSPPRLYITTFILFSLQAMGRVGEVICRTWQTADKMKKLRGKLAEETVKINK